MEKHLHIEVKGDINHQGYDFHTMFNARQLKLKGWVREQKGKIVIEAQGEDMMLTRLLDFFTDLPSEIDPFKVKFSEKPIENFAEDFEIIR